MPVRLRQWGALLVLGAPVAWSQQELSLDQAVSLALQNNRRIEISKAEIRKTTNAMAVSRTYRLPQLSFTTLEGQLLAPMTFLFPPGVFGVFPQIGPVPPGPSPVTTARRPFNLMSGQVVQPLTQQFRIGLGIDAEKLNQRIAEEKLSLEEQTVVNDVKKTYYNILQAQSALRATEETVTLFRELDRVASNALAQEAALKSDVLDAQAGLAKTELEMSTLRDTSSTLKERMNTLLGRDLVTDFTVSAAPEIKPWELDLASTRARALAQRPELREAQLKVQLAETDRRAKRSEYLPDVSLRFDYLSARNLEVLPKNVAAVSLLLTWEPFDWGRKKHELASKTDVVEQARTAVEEAASQIQVEVGLNFRKLEQARQQLRVANLALEADREKVRVALNRYEQNVVLFKDVLQLRTSLAEKTYKYQETLSSFWNARADLEKATGER